MDMRTWLRGAPGVSLRPGNAPSFPGSCDNAGAASSRRLRALVTAGARIGTWGAVAAGPPLLRLLRPPGWRRGGIPPSPRPPAAAMLLCTSACAQADVLAVASRWLRALGGAGGAGCELLQLAVPREALGSWRRAGEGGGGRGEATALWWASGRENCRHRTASRRRDPARSAEPHRSRRLLPVSQGRWCRPSGLAQV